jgi:hypothetical protein
MLCEYNFLLFSSSLSADRASALFVGVYEPAKQKLLTMFPENFSAFAHLV